jgi:glycosyltransferase involved in cell wall biosynthesis
MKFIFIDSFHLRWNGKTARYEHGISGSHSAILYLAEALAKHHSVDVISTVNNILEGTYLNVNYINAVHVQSTICDVIVFTNELSGLSILNKIACKRVLILTQNDLYNYHALKDIPTQKVIICYISEFAKRNILQCQPFLKAYPSMLLYNSIDVHDIPCPEMNKKNTICYFACIERGYKMTVEIIKCLENYTLYTNTYNPGSRRLFVTDAPNVCIVESSAKYTILDYVKRSKYFVYPLINLDNNVIHYDTFGYVVLEALLSGTIVIAPKIGVYDELYGDAICYVDTEDIIPKEDLLNWKRQNSNFGYPLLQRYLDTIHMLDKDTSLQQSYINKGLLLRDKFSHVNISATLLKNLAAIK